MANVRVDIDVGVPRMVRDFIEENEESVAREIEANARASTAFQDWKGTGRESISSKTSWGKLARKLRQSIKAKKSRYELGGWIVAATAPHAHLVEYGHELIDWRTNKRIGRVQGTKFLRTAKERAIASAMSKFGVR